MESSQYLSVAFQGDILASQRAENENWKKPNIQKTNLFGKKLQFVIDSSGIKRQILFYILFGKYSYTTFQFPVYIPYKQLDQGLKRQGHKNVDPILAKKTLPGQNRKKWYRKISRRYSRKIHGDTTMTPRGPTVYLKVYLQYTCKGTIS